MVSPLNKILDVHLIQWVPAVLSAWVKPPECEGDHSLPCTAEVKHEWSCASLPPICLHHVDGEDFTLVVLKMGIIFLNRYFLVAPYFPAHKTHFFPLKM
jgi:hypothetical protein